ncbi:MAG: ComEA family DNA-binding protein [Desulfobacterales bacterium]
MKRIASMTPLLAILMIVMLFPYPAVSEETAVKININTAGLEELTTLNRIGPRYAQRIIDYRENVGPFTEPQEIMKVKGIGLRTYEANKDIICVE